MARATEADWAKVLAAWMADPTLSDGALGALIGVSKAAVRKRRLKNPAQWRLKDDVIEPETGAASSTKSNTSASTKSTRSRTNRIPGVDAPDPDGDDVDERDDAYSRLPMQQARFVDEFLIDLNATQAALRAGYSSKTAYSIACELLKKPDVKSAVALQKERRMIRVEIQQDDVLRQLRDIAFADTNELIECRTINCRYCWGEGFRHQRTMGEMVLDLEAHNRRIEEHEDGRRKKHPGEFDEKGGVGYRRNGEPNPACPECGGDGVQDVRFKDTRYLSSSARAIYAGTEITKDGMKLRLHSKMHALEMLAKHTRVFDDAPPPAITVFDVAALEAIHREALEVAAANQAAIRGRQQSMGLEIGPLKDND